MYHLTDILLKQLKNTNENVSRLHNIKNQIETLKSKRIMWIVWFDLSVSKYVVSFCLKPPQLVTFDAPSTQTRRCEVWSRSYVKCASRIFTNLCLYVVFIMIKTLTQSISKWRCGQIHHFVLVIMVAILMLLALMQLTKWHISMLLYSSVFDIIFWVYLLFMWCFLFLFSIVTCYVSYESNHPLICDTCTRTRTWNPARAPNLSPHLLCVRPAR